MTTPTGPDPARLSASTHQPAIDSPLIAAHDATADQTQQLPAHERDHVHSGWCNHGSCEELPAPPSEADSAGEDDEVARIVGDVLLASTQSAWEDLAIPPRSWGREAARQLRVAGLLATSPGLQGGDGEAPTSSEPRSDLTSAPGMSSPLDGEARERLAQWLWQHDGMKPEQWSQARETTREDWRREADLALRAAGGAR